MRVLGIDPSTWLGLARLDADGEAMGKLINFPKAKGFDRVQLIAQEFERTLTAWKPDLVMIEGYAFANKNSLVTLVEIGTLLRYTLHSFKHPWYEVPPTVLKKWTTGSGSAKKEQMAQSVKSRWGFCSHSDDIVDAYALAQMGQLGESVLAAIKGVIREH